MIPLVLAILFTLGVSAFCSLLEAMILSTSTVDIENLKKRFPKRGNMLEQQREELEETTSAILSLNTIANTLGATVVGGLAVELFPGENTLLSFSGGMTVGILLFSEILPKNIGVMYRGGLQPLLVYPLATVRWSMFPLSRMGRFIVRFLVGKREESASSDAEIIMLAERSEREGSLSKGESKLVRNALRLDEITVREIMTPRTVVTALEATDSLDQVFRAYPNIPFARLPVYRESIDDIIGMVRRRDLLQAMAEDKPELKVEALMQEVIFVPEHASATAALQKFISSHQQLAVAVDEFGSISGVVTMEDIVEHLIGQEIFEKDDLAVDMRELARKKKLAGERR